MNGPSDNGTVGRYRRHHLPQRLGSVGPVVTHNEPSAWGKSELRTGALDQPPKPYGRQFAPIKGLLVDRFFRADATRLPGEVVANHFYVGDYCSDRQRHAGLLGSG